MSNYPYDDPSYRDPDDEADEVREAREATAQVPEGAMVTFRTSDGETARGEVVSSTPTEFGYRYDVDVWIPTERTWSHHSITDQQVAR